MKKYLLLLLIIGFLSSCKRGYDQQKLAALQAELAAAQDDLDKMRADFEFIKTAREKEGPAGLVHQVYFKLKPGITEAEKAAFVTELKGLRAIEQVSSLTVGEFEDLKDPRAITGYGVALIVSFAGKEDYDAYQQNDIHLKMKENTAKYLGGPPAAYDFMAR